MTGTVLVSTDGTNRGASMAKRSAEFRSEAPLCQRISSVIAQTTFKVPSADPSAGDLPQNYLDSEGDAIIGLVGFEPTACRRGDRSTIACRVRPCLVQSCSIARVVLLRCEWQSFRYGPEPRAHRVSLLWTRQRCGAECGQPNSRKNLRNVDRFSGCARRSNKTFFNTSGWWDLNPRPPGPEPGALPS